MDSAQNNEINNNNASINGKDSFLDYIVSIGYEPKDYLAYIDLSLDPYSHNKFIDYQTKVTTIIKYEKERKEQIRASMKSNLDSMLALVARIESRYPNKDDMPKDDLDRINIIKRRAQSIGYKLGFKASEANLDLISKRDTKANEEIMKIEKDTSLTPQERLTKMAPYLEIKRRNNLYYDRTNALTETPSMLDEESVFKNAFREYEDVQKAFSGLTTMTKSDLSQGPSPKSDTDEYDEYNQSMVDLMDEVHDYHTISNEELNIKKSAAMKKENDEIKSETETLKDEVPSMDSKSEEELLYDNDIKTNDELNSNDSSASEDEVIDSLDTPTDSNNNEEKADELTLEEDKLDGSSLEDEQPSKIVRVKKWIKNHKKEILIALGITALTIGVILALNALLPAIIASIKASSISSLASQMMANGQMWGPAILKDKALLHWANIDLAHLITATSGTANVFNTTTGVWTIGTQTLPAFAQSAAAIATKAASKVAITKLLTEAVSIGGLGLLGGGLLSKNKTDAYREFITKFKDIKNNMKTNSKETIENSLTDLTIEINNSTDLTNEEKTILLKKIKKTLNNNKDREQTMEIIETPSMGMGGI